MADSKRQQIIDAIATKMAEINTGNGYNTNAGNKVFKWLIRDLDKADLPAIEIRWTGQETDAGIDLGHHRHSLAVEIDVVANGTTAPAIVESAIADVYTAIGTDTTYGGLAIDTDTEGDSIEVDQGEDKIARGTITITCDCATQTSTTPDSLEACQNAFGYLPDCPQNDIF